MKILYVLASGNPGGAEIQGVRLLDAMRQRGIDAQLALYYGYGTMPGNIREFVESHDIPCRDFFGWTQPEVPMHAWFEAEQPDAVISCGYPTGLYVLPTAERAGVPVRILRLESCGHLRDEFRQDEAIERAGMRAATHVVGNSADVVASIEQYAGGDMDKAQVIANGVTIPALSPELRARAQDYWGFGDGALIVGYLANFRSGGLKNQLMLVRVADQVVRQHPNVHFVMVGSDDVYAQAVRGEIYWRGLENNVHLPGRLDDLDMLAGWDIAVSCSYSEGLSNANMECMAYGLPMVLSDVEGNRALGVYDGVALVPVNDDAAMTERLLWAICSPAAMYRAGRHNREAMTLDYGWDGIVEQWRNLLT